MFGHGRLYTVVFQAVSVSATQDLFYIKPAADKICFLEGVYVSNVAGTADAGDAQEELLRVEILRLASTVTVGSGGNSYTPAPVNVNDAAAGFTARINDTTAATSSGSTTVMHADGWNVRVPFSWPLIPEHRHVVANAQALTVKLNLAPNDAVTCNGTAYVRELP